MKKIILKGPYDVMVEEADIPRISDDQFLVRTIITGISAGTELMWYKGTNPGLASGRVKYPATPGYEHVGEVIEIGKDVDKVALGDKVLTGFGHQEYAVVSQKDLFCLIPNHLKPEEALFASITSTAVHAIHQSAILLGDIVAVVGMGVLGSMAAQVARAAGASKVIVVDIAPFKLDMAEKMGNGITVNPDKQDLHKVVAEVTDGTGVDIAIEAAGNAGAVATAFETVRKKGKLVVAGFQTKPFSLSGELFWDKEPEVIAVRASGPPDMGYEYTRWHGHANFKEAFRLIADGKITGTPMITHRFLAQDIEKTYRLIDEKKEDFMQIILSWDKL